LYPINQVPRGLVDKLKKLEGICSNCEEAIAATINLISDTRNLEWRVIWNFRG